MAMTFHELVQVWYPAAKKVYLRKTEAHQEATRVAIVRAFNGK